MDTTLTSIVAQGSSKSTDKLAILAHLAGTYIKADAPLPKSLTLDWKVLNLEVILPVVKITW